MRRRRGNIKIHGVDYEATALWGGVGSSGYSRGLRGGSAGKGGIGGVEVMNRDTTLDGTLLRIRGETMRVLILRIGRMEGKP
jgi:hypothetical protein